MQKNNLERNDPRTGW